MQKSFKVYFGAVIVFILLALYATTLVYMIKEVREQGKADPTQAHEFPAGRVAVVTTIGGLVSALVVSRLAITEPGDFPRIMPFTKSSDREQSWLVTVLSALYLGVWLIVGLAALVVGLMMYPEVNQTVSDIGTTWLGLMVASGYAWFGIKP